MCRKNEKCVDCDYMWDCPHSHKETREEISKMNTFDENNIGDIHELKTLPGYFIALIGGRKPFEVRKKDRDFKVNDILILKEYEPSKRSSDYDEETGYTGRELRRKISYILDDPDYCKEGYVILGLSI
jgi:hypothetical protein